MLTVYGADSCEDTQRSLRLLRRLGVPYRYENVDQDPDALATARQLNDGRRQTPTIRLAGEALVEPTNAQLTEALERHGLVSRDRVAERLRYRNVGDLERGVRIVGALAAFGLASRMTSAWKWPLAVWGAYEAVSGGLGWCALYSALDVTSLAGPGDHPREAERIGWWAESLALPQAVHNR